MVGRKSADPVKRVHHNELERKRRTRLSESFVALRNAINLHSEHRVSRRETLLQAAKFITKNTIKWEQEQRNINDISVKIERLKQEICRLEGKPCEECDNKKVVISSDSSQSESDLDLDNPKDPDWNLYNYRRN
ncbi:protein mxl-3-like [Onthophagus taurus]|uniref:protein mxl-3-like n=1 Tax=Onthophagus taurus TaxID=166361 RepID=UPI000C2055AF|nr:protein max-like [Onthophagus taurus]